MAWDKDRPYAPFWNRTDIWQERFDSMDSYGNGENITPEKIDIMYANGVYVPPDVKRWNRKTEQYEDYAPSYVWRPFKEVHMTLTLDHFEHRRAAGIFWWVDTDGRRYPMFATEFNRLLDEHLLAQVITGTWSAEKRGANYGIRLVW